MRCSVQAQTRTNSQQRLKEDLIKSCIHGIGPLQDVVVHGIEALTQFVLASAGNLAFPQ